MFDESSNVTEMFTGILKTVFVDDADEYTKKTDMTESTEVASTSSLGRDPQQIQIN